MRLVLVLVVALGGCAETPDQRAQEVCASFCDCVVGTGLPAAVQDCIDNQCLPQIPPVTDDCLSCVHQFEASCTALENTCAPSCFQILTPKLGGP